MFFSFFSCAKRGFITGGFKDTIAPKVLSCYPKNASTNFKGNQIKISFDEYIKLKDVNKQLIVSPPMATPPSISPLNATKEIIIKLSDSLQKNTTYSFNFGKSIEDNNEGNPYHQFKYIFSTGNAIDSLSLSGTIKDARDKKTESFVSVMLYEINSKFSDSIIYKHVPTYVTNTLDSAKTFKIENIKSGKYLLVALKDTDANNVYNPNTDKIGFRKQFVTIPNDSVFNIELFKETPKFNFKKPFQVANNKMVIGFEGNYKKSNIKLKSKSQELPIVVTRFPKKDSLQIWFKPLISDTLKLEITSEQLQNQFVVKTKKAKSDSLTFEPIYTGVLPLRDNFAIRSSRPLTKFDFTKLKLIDASGNSISVKPDYDEFNQLLHFNFKPEPLQKYNLTLLPGAITDFFESTNDTLVYKFSTKNTSDYGNLKIVLENKPKCAVVVELTNDKGAVMYSLNGTNQTIFDFANIDPALYTVRVVFDENGNEYWDSGNFLNKTQSEKVIYFPKLIDVRPNWDVEQVFDLKF